MSPLSTRLLIQVLVYFCNDLVFNFSFSTFGGSLSLWLQCSRVKLRHNYQDIDGDLSRYLAICGTKKLKVQLFIFVNICGTLSL